MSQTPDTDETFAILTAENGLTTFFRGGAPEGAITLTRESWLAAHDAAVARAAEAATAVLPRVTYKADIWRRCTDAQAVALDALLKGQTVRQQRIFNDATQINHADPLFADLHAGIAAAFDAETADALLAPSQG